MPNPLLRFFKTFIRYRDVFPDPAAEAQLIERLKTFKLNEVLTVVSKINLVLHNERYDNPQVQPALCASFFSPEMLQKLVETERRFKKNDPTDRRIIVFHHFQMINLAKLAILNCSDEGGAGINSEDECWRFGLCCLMMNDLLMPEAPEPAGASVREEILSHVIRVSHAEKEDRFQYGIARAYELFVEIPKDLSGHPQFYDFPTVFSHATHLTIAEYIALGYVLFSWWAQINLSNVTISPYIYIDPNQFFRDCRTDRAKLETIFRQIALTPEECRRNLQQELASAGESWRFRYSNMIFEKYPVVAYPSHLICVSMRFLCAKFTRNLFHGISNVLPISDTKRYRDFVGRIFEEYVRRVLTRMFARRCVVEYYGCSREEAGEAVIVYPRVLIVVEAKSSRLSLEINQTGDPEQFRQALNRIVITGAQQIERVIMDFRSGRFAIDNVKERDIGRLYPIIITIESLPQEFFTQREIDRLIKTAGIMQGQDIAPLSILSIEELEYLEPLLKTLSLVDILGDKTSRDDYRDMSMKNYLFVVHGSLPRNEMLKERFAKIQKSAEDLLKLEAPG